MSKRMRTLLFAGVAVLVLVALLVALLLLPSSDGDTTATTTTQQSTSVRLWDKTGNDANDKAITVSSVTVTQGESTYTLTADEDGNLLVDTYKTLAHDTTATASLASQVKSVVASRLVEEEPASAEKFGFDKADGNTVTVSATYSDGTSFAFELGDENPSGEGVYLRVKDSKAIYLYNASSASVFYNESTVYLSKSPIAAPALKDGDDYASDTVVVREAELSGSVRPSTIYFQVSGEDTVEGEMSLSPAGYFLHKPYFRGVDVDCTLIDATVYTNFVAEGIAAVNPTTAHLTSFGLNKPYSQCDFTLAVRHETTEKNDDDKNVTTYSYYNVFKYTVKLGSKTEDGLRYAAVYSEGKLLPMIYLVDESSVTWAQMQYDDIADRFLFYTYIRNVDTMKFALDGVSTTFKLQHLDEEEDEDLKVTANGKTYDAASYRLLYQELMGLMRSAATTDKPSGEAVFALDITVNNELIQNTSLKIYRHTASRYLVRHSTGETYLVDAKDIEPFFEQYRTLLAQ